MRMLGQSWAPHLVHYGDLGLSYCHPHSFLQPEIEDDELGDRTGRRGSADMASTTGPHRWMRKTSSSSAAASSFQSPPPSPASLTVCSEKDLGQVSQSSQRLDLGGSSAPSLVPNCMPAQSLDLSPAKHAAGSSSRTCRSYEDALEHTCHAPSASRRTDQQETNFLSDSLRA